MATKAELRAPKPCACCGKMFVRRSNYSEQMWEKQICCSISCSMKLRLSQIDAYGESVTKKCPECGRKFKTAGRDVCIHCHRKANMDKMWRYTNQHAEIEPPRLWKEANDTEVAAQWLSVVGDDIRLTSEVKIYTPGSREFEEVARLYERR